ncbi:PREDICTED: uncharacterized protein LOC106124541 [Papilio xuthus]|uniref:Uncharacterized protein LOC106124541 n=1 Tax=Papilio xuthus TaxID=66420 RepID=A0AAJ6ZPS4_PAPXU|nr:PREDICTED: uncharacterized protein LOC106124541 [Papilio xuthus]
MISSNRVQAIKSKFENLNVENVPVVRKRIAPKQLCIQSKVSEVGSENIYIGKGNITERNEISFKEKSNSADSDSSDDISPKPNHSYLYSEVKRTAGDTKKLLSRQTSDPGKKLHRSHAFRCDRSQKINDTPKRHGSCNGRSESGDFTLKMGEKKLSKDRLKRLGNLLEDQMKKENFKVTNNKVIVGEIQMIRTDGNSIPDSQVPKHILDQYAKVVKKKDTDNKQDAMTDSGVSSETENLEEEKFSKIKQLVSHYEKPDITLNIPEIKDNVQETETVNSDVDKTNLESMNDLCASSETMKLERKNPHLVLTDTLKKALKQPLPPGPPPKKPPRVFAAPIPEATAVPQPESPEKKRKDTKKMIEKLEKALQRKEAQNQSNKHIYDVVEADMSKTKPKEMHYLCTEVLDIAQRSLMANQNILNPITNCFTSLNCAIVNNHSTLSLPYTRLSAGTINRDSGHFCTDNGNCNDCKPRLSTFIDDKIPNECSKCHSGDGFKCYLNCKCKDRVEEKENQCNFTSYLKSDFRNTLAYTMDEEPIYDEPYVGDCDVPIVKKSEYGTLSSWRFKENCSKSLEDLRIADKTEDKKIYDIPYELSRPTTPDFTKSTKIDFRKLRQNFEVGFSDTETEINKTMSKESLYKGRVCINEAKKIFDNNNGIAKEPLLTKKVSKSTDNVSEDFKTAKKTIEKQFNTDTRRYRKFEKADIKPVTRFSLAKKDNTQLDVDRENLNRLMTEIYETVSAACNMDDNKPGCFPTELSDGSTSEESVRLTRSLTEKRKNYVRRVSSRVAYLDPKNVKSLRFRHQTSICSYKSEIIDNPYSTFRSWKSFRASQSNLAKDKMADVTDSKFNLTDSSGNVLSMKDDLTASDDSIDNQSIDEKTGCVDIGLPFEPRERGLFNICLLVGMNYMTGQAYVKSVFPSQVVAPAHIENLVFPETLCGTQAEVADARAAQQYSLVLTDERGERSYGYCRRVLPEGATTCLPLCYCLIGKYRAPGFYYKVLQEIESQHGNSEVETNLLLQQLFESDFPNPGEDIIITYTRDHDQTVSARNSVNLGEIFAKTGADVVSTDRQRKLLKVDSMPDNVKDMPEFYDLHNNNSPKRVLLDLEGPRTKIIKRPIEPRVDEDNFSVLLDSFGAGLVIKVFSSLLLERKVVIMGNQLSVVSSCMEGLQAALYPLVWQQPLIASIPADIQREVLEAPLPILAGMLSAGDTHDTDNILFEEGMLIDLTHPNKVLFYQGDESTILPTSSYKTLKTSLQMESIKQKDKQEDTKTRNVMISEAFLRFFVDILGDFWKFFVVRELKEGEMGKNGVVFDKETFVKNASSKQNQYFLEWFSETAMFNHFIQNMAACYPRLADGTPQTNASPLLTPQGAQLVDTPLPNFYELFQQRLTSRNKSEHRINDSKNNYKSAMNKKVKMLKTKLRELVT